MEKDQALIRYFSNNARYADLINGFGFDGKQVIRAEELTELDSQTGFWQTAEEADAGERKKRRQGKKYRDLIRKTAIGVNFMIVGIENQDEVNYLMPLRVMSYDAGEYERQAAEIRKQIRERKGLTRAEFLSGFGRSSKMSPCVTIVLYYGQKEWDGSRDLHGILDFTDIPKQVKKLVGNYEINLLEIARTENTDVYKTDLKQVFDFIRCSGNKEELLRLVQENPEFSELEEDAYDIAVTFADAKELVHMKKQYEGGRVNMCKGLTDLLEDSRKAGMEEGMEAGMKTARKEAIRIFITSCEDFGISYESTFDKITEKYKLDKEETRAYMDQYWTV